MAPLVLFSLGIAIVAVLLGRAAREDRWLTARVLLFGAAVAIAAAGLAATRIDPAVPDGDVVGGLLIAAGAGAFAVVVFYTAGYLVRPGWLLAVVLVVLAVPYVFYVFLALLWVLALVYCGPDDYECPV